MNKKLFIKTKYKLTNIYNNYIDSKDYIYSGNSFFTIKKYLNQRTFIEFCKDCNNISDLKKSAFLFRNKMIKNYTYDYQKPLPHKDSTTHMTIGFNNRNSEYWMGKESKRFCPKCRVILGTNLNCQNCGSETISTRTVLRVPRKHQLNKWKNILKTYK